MADQGIENSRTEPEAAFEIPVVIPEPHPPEPSARRYSA